MRKLASAVFLMTGIVIGLGAFGHDSNAVKLAQTLAAAPALEPADIKVILAVWHFCSGCMLVFGATCVWTWWQIRKGAAGILAAPVLIGVFYVVSGLATVAYTGVPFFWLFAVLGGLLLGSALALRPAIRK